MRATGRKSRMAGDNGVVVIEFALLLPLVLLLLFGIIQFGRAYNAKVELTGAVREGARVLALNSGDPVTATLDAAPGLDQTKITITTSTSPCTAGDDVWVQAAYDFPLEVPFWSGSGTVTLYARGVMRCGG